MSVKVLNEGGTAFIGHTHYVPFRGSDNFLMQLFFQLFDDIDRSFDIGTAAHMTRRDLLNIGSANSKLFAIGTHHYGLPSVQPNVVVPQNPNLFVQTKGSIEKIETDNSLSLVSNVPNFQIVDVSTDSGARQFIRVNGANMHYEDDYPPVPVLIKQITLPESITVSSDPQVNVNQTEHFENILMPKVLNVSKSSGLNPYSGERFGYKGSYPEKIFNYKVIKEVGGRHTIIARFFPIQYNAENKTVTLNKEIKVTFNKAEKTPDPLVNLELEHSFEQADGSMRLTLRNIGQMNAVNLRIIETLPDNVTVDSSSLNGGVYETDGNSATITWMKDTLSSEVPNNFQIMGYNVAFAADGEYKFSCTVSYGSSAGVASDDLVVSKTVQIEGLPSQPEPPKEETGGGGGGGCFLTTLSK
jgi:hypothetical protein